MRYHILYSFKDGPWGGGNQFLKALRTALVNKSNYSDDPFQADVLLFNSHHFGEQDQDLNLLQELRTKRPNLPFIHRVDGPIKLVRGGQIATDKLIFKANSMLADATVFQTRWSYEQSLRLGLKPKEPMTQIINAPDPSLFYPAENREPGPKFKLIASSWAANRRKGFDIYEYLDEHLDFERYEMSFVGNSRCPFKNIKHYPPMDSKALADLLRQHDIYIAASMNDPCSNALCEGLNCSLPVLARNSGGHPEIIGEGGVTFENTDDILEKLDVLAQDYETYRQKIDVPNIDHIATQYLDFAQKVLTHNHQTPSLDIEQLKRKMAFTRFKERIHSGLKRRLKLTGT